jgi:phosphoribosylformylglycinamidine synthase
VGGEVVFDRCYQGNPLVNVLCLGLLPRDRLVLAKATGAGNLAVLLGSSTGRDGIGGVSVLASAGFDEGSEDKRPAVQVGDPFEEKRLIEACLALLDAGLVVGIQDLGGAGLTCAASETAANGGMGMDFDVSAVPRREDGMEPFEVMTSESQERMLAIVTPEGLPEVLRLCERWDVAATVVGRVTEPDDQGVGMLRVLDGFDGPVLAEVPASSLHDAAPLYDRPRAEPADLAERQGRSVPAPGADEVSEILVDLLCDTTWVSSQYDHQLFLNTVEGPGGDAVVLRLKHPVTGEDTGRGLALTTDGNHRWCAVDPRQGTAQTVAESVVNLACVGARPIAVVNCLNFGNPEHPEVMWQLSEAVDGMAEACSAFGLPVIGGNVSLYNESKGVNIDPTPVIGMLGVVDELTSRPPGVGQQAGATLVLVGDDLTGPPPSLAGSAVAWRSHDRNGVLPAADLAAVSATATVVRSLARNGAVTGVHDVSTGGLALALAELAVRSAVGTEVTGIPSTAHLFSEVPGRVVLAVAPDRVDEVLEAAAGAGVATALLGSAGGTRFVLRDAEGALLVDQPLDVLTAAWRDRLLAALGAGTVQA